MKLLVEGQKIISFDSPPIRLVAGSTEFVPIELQCSSDWDGLLMTVQFIQKSKTINEYIGEARTLNVPADISAGWLMISCFGAKADTAVFGTVNGYEIEVYPAGLSSTEQEPIPPTPNLYNQLISEIKRYAEETEASADKVKEAQETSAQAKAIADQIQENAENGVYNGRDGEQGPQGIQGPTGPQGPQGLKGEPGTTDFNELQSIPFTPILSDTLEVTTLNEGAYVVNFESVNVLVNGESPLSTGEPFTIPKGTFIFKASDGQMGLVGNFGGAYIPNSSDVNSWRDGADFVSLRDLDEKQDTLVSGENIKTINNESILGRGNFELPKSSITIISPTTIYSETKLKEGLYYSNASGNLLIQHSTSDTTGLPLSIEKGTFLIIQEYSNQTLVLYSDVRKMTDYDDYINGLQVQSIFWNNGEIIKSSSQNPFAQIKDASQNIDFLTNILINAIINKEENQLVVTSTLNNETGINNLKTIGTDNSLKIENQELSVNTEGLDISKATVEDATAGINKTELISLIKDNLQIKSVSTGLKFENGVLSLDIVNGDNLKYGTSTQSTETNGNEVVTNE